MEERIEDPTQLDLFTSQLQGNLDAYLTAIDWMSEPSVLMLFSLPDATRPNELAHPMLRVKGDMSIEFGPTYSPDVAAQEFWHAVEVEGRSLAERLLDAVNLVEENMERAERSSSCYIIADAEREALRLENAELRLKLKAAGLY